MLIVAIKLLLFALVIGGLILWIASIVESDGECNMENCDLCMWSGDCEYEKKREDTE